MMIAEVTPLSRKEHAKVILLFVGLTLWYSYQCITSINGVRAADGAQELHWFWWAKHALMDFRNPYYTDYYFYPQGANLAFASGPLIDVLLTLPISILIGTNAAYNCSIVLGFFFSAYFAFLLAYELTGSKGASVVAGITFAFSPYHFLHAPVHVILSAMHLVVLYLFLLKRALYDQALKWTVLSGLAMAAVILFDELQAIFAVLVTISILLVRVFDVRVENMKPHISLSREGATTFKTVLMVALVSAVGSSIFLYVVADFFLHAGSTLKMGPFERGGANMFGADLLSFIAPPTYNRFWGGVLPAITAKRNEFFLGYIPLLLLLVGVYGYFRLNVVKFVALATATTFILSLGITLHLNGVWEWGGKHINLPYYYLSDVVPFSLIRTPDRFHMLTVLGVSLLTAFGARYLLARCNVRTNAIVAGLLSLLVLVEFMPGKLGFQEIKNVPAIYKTIAKDSEPYTVLELPLSRWSSLEKNGSGSPSELLYYQTIHNKRIFNGFGSRVTSDAMNFNDVVLDSLVNLTGYENYNLIAFGKRKANPAEQLEALNIAKGLLQVRSKFVDGYKVKYVILHAPLNYQGSMSRIFIEEFFGGPMIDVPADGLSYVKVGL